ncbi:HAAS signaling domain-containing protein [Sphaerimonospora thailandensis]|uniref:Proline-rich protein n=1 Tax=Sphaerimonospora thailandensis TaxID=795644 RepID=A0A8J3W0R5_9ACTN|nr:hypothetical protein Mth01_41500 [Sphaerimonospora thailandensis]
MNSPMTPKAYADAVREALADLPAKDREALLEDLDDHLAEVAAEHGLPLEERLGSPEAYAAELRAAYGGRARDESPSIARRVGRRVTAKASGVHGRMLRLPPYRQAAAFAPELRPAWWVLRGYAIAIGVLAQFPTPGYLPDDLAEWVFTLAVIWASVWLGRSTRTAAAPTWGRLLLLGGNALAVFLVLIALADARRPSYVAIDSGPRPAGNVWVENTATFGDGDVYNIFPYAEDGTPLRNVRLYDQDGRPITTLDPEMYDQRLAIPCGGEPPIRNAYPLPLTPITEDDRGMPESADCVPSAEMPTPTPVPSPAATAEGAPSASPSPTPEPTPEPTAEPTPSPSPGKSRR